MVDGIRSKYNALNCLNKILKTQYAIDKGSSKNDKLKQLSKDFKAKYPLLPAIDYGMNYSNNKITPQDIADYVNLMDGKK